MNRECADDITPDLQHYPSLEEYKARLDSILAMNLATLSYDELSELFYEKAILFNQAFGVNPAAYFNLRTFFRCRFRLGEGENPDFIRTHSYPPAVVCKENGRANLKGRSVFYCSEYASTAILESKPNPGDYGLMSVWQGTTTRDVKYGICLHSELQRKNEFRQMAENIDKLMIQESAARAGDKSAHLQYLYKLVADRFVHEEYPYPFTSWISNEMLYMSQPKDYIIYPSVANSQFTCNLAFHPNSADALLRFQKVWRFKLLDITGAIIKTAEHQIGELDRSHMRWRKPHADELSQLMPNGQYR